MTLLIRAHADVDATSTDGYTPLHYACRAASLAGVELLLRQHASVNVTSFSDGRTAFFLAALTECVPLIRTMLDNSADPTIPDSMDMSPLRALREKPKSPTNTRAVSASRRGLSHCGGSIVDPLAPCTLACVIVTHSASRSPTHPPCTHAHACTHHTRTLRECCPSAV